MAPQLSSLSFIAISLLLSVASACTGDLAHDSPLQFTYSGIYGPDKWGNLSPNFSACSSGKFQSPINIIKDEAVLNKNLGPLTRDYKPANATLVNNGFNIGVFFDGSCGTLMAEDQKYTFKQMHWHSPSEHQIDGVQYAAEGHLVHQADSGSFTVVSILYKLGHADPFITKVMKRLGDLGKDKCAGNIEKGHIPLGMLDDKLLRKKTHKYYRYIGSLTTPPCRENVTWNILGKVRTISKEQLEALKAPLDSACKQNSRPVQPLDGRKIERYEEYHMV